VYLFLYSVHYFVTKLQIVGHTSTFLYFGYTSIMVLLFSLLTGVYVCNCLLAHEAIDMKLVKEIRFHAVRMRESSKKIFAQDLSKIPKFTLFLVNVFKFY